MEYMLMIFSDPEGWARLTPTQAAEVPACQLPVGDQVGPRLGWNTWLQSQPRRADAPDAIFTGEELRWAG